MLQFSQNDVSSKNVGQEVQLRRVKLSE